MSTISTIVDTIRTRLATVLPSHKKLKNNSNIILNDTLFLAQGQTLQVSSAFNTNRVLGCQLSLTRSVVVSITRQSYGTLRDDALRETTEKALLEDHYLVVKDLEKDPDLNSTCARFVYVSDTGIQEIFIEELQFLMIQITFEFEYFENLT